MKIILHPLAEEDLDESIRYYVNIDKNLKNKFLKELDYTFNQIKDNPNLYPLVTKHSHKKVMQKFPYIIYYTTYDNNINILAIFHTSRNPNILNKRLS